MDASGYKKGLDEASEKTSSFGSIVKGALGSALAVGATAITGATTALAGLAKQSVQAYADFEQLTGGVQTLFGTEATSVEEYAESVGKSVSEVEDEYNNLLKAQETVFANADEAYRTAGLSANEYMETVTGFSASLISSLEGDTVRASELANQAVIDMADNANKMGSSMESIQNAYAGFAKQNYTMLDNLKLGYGGTQQEMERLLADAQAISGVEYDISSYGDVVEAIHTIQTEMGIAGTTAREASETISGSISMLGGAWENLVAGFAKEDVDLGKLIDDVVNSALTVLNNIVPRIETALPNIASGIQQAITKVTPLITQVIEKMLPSLLQSVMSLANGIVQALPSLVQVIADALPQVIETIVSNSGGLIDAVMNILKIVGQFLADNIDIVIEAITEMVSQIAGFIGENASDFVELALAIITALATALLDNLPTLIDSSGELISNLVDAIIQNLPNLFATLVQVIASLIQNMFGEGGILDSINNSLDNIWGTITGAVGNWIDIAKNWLSERLSGISEWFGSVIEKVREKFEEIKEHIQEKFQEIQEKGVAYWLGEIIGSIAKFFVDAFEKVKEFFNSIPERWDNFKNTISTKWSNFVTNTKTKFADFVSNVKEKVQEMKEAINNKVDEVKDYLSELPNKIKNFFTSLPEELKTIGKNIVDGLYNGIKNNWNAFIEKIKQLIGDFVQGIKDKLGIASPSKLFRDQIGKNLALGIGVGFEAEMPDVADDMFATIPTEYSAVTEVTGYSASESFQNEAIDMLNELVLMFREGTAKTDSNISNTRELRRVTVG